MADKSIMGGEFIFQEKCVHFVTARSFIGIKMIQFQISANVSKQVL